MYSGNNQGGIFIINTLMKIYTNMSYIMTMISINSLTTIKSNQIINGSFRETSETTRREYQSVGVVN